MMIPRTASILRNLAVVMLLAAVLGGCRSSRNVPSADGGHSRKGDSVAQAVFPVTLQECYATVAGQYAAWERLRIPAKVTLRSPKAVSISGTAIMDRGKSVMISLKFFGMEVGALYVTNDSVLVVDKMKKRYFTDRTESLLGGFPANVSNLQDMLLGRAFIVGCENVPDVARDMEFDKIGDEMWLMSAKTGIVDYGFSFSPWDTLLGLVICVADRYPPVMCEYAPAVTTGYGPFSPRFAISANLPKMRVEAFMEWDFKKARWNEEVELRTLSVTPKYTRINPSDFSKMLKTDQ